MKVKELIKMRKSVRTYDGRTLTVEDRKCLREYISTVSNPFGVPVEIRVLEAKEYGLTSPVIVGEKSYIAAKVAKVPDHEMAFGYSFEKVCLYALSRGLGTVMLAATINRPAFEKAMELEENEILPVASPVGYPAKKRSLRESMMRKGIKADDRLPFETLFFSGDFDHSLRKEDAGVFGEALEMARWSPSAANKQPWRAVMDGDKVHFYEAKSMKDNALGDIQKLDVGIALAHFDLTLQEEGVRGRFVHSAPTLSAPDNTFYLITYQIAG